MLLLPAMPASAATTAVTGLDADCGATSQTGGGIQQTTAILGCTIAVHEQTGACFASYQDGKLSGDAANLITVNGGYDAKPVCVTVPAYNPTGIQPLTAFSCVSFGLKDKPAATVASVGTLPQSGDPAASWRQQVPLACAVLAVGAGVMAVGLRRRRA